MTELRVGTPFVSRDLAIVPIVAVQSDSHSGRRGISAWGFKVPTAVVLCKEPEVQAVDILGREVDLDDLVADVPGLRELLEELCAT